MTAPLEALPTVTRGRIKYPLVLPRHSAFQTPLMARGGPVRSALCAASLPPAIPLVDGTGRLWPAGDTATLGALRQYTIREQVLTPYHFGRSVEAGIEALDPEVLVLLGPGSSF